MMKIHKKTILVSTILIFLSIFLLPYSSIDNIKCKFGYPFSYLTIYNTYDILKEKKFILSIININFFNLIINIVIVYILCLIIKNIFSKIIN